MTKEELEKEAKAECFMLTVNTIGIDQKDIELAYILGRKKSIKQIETLEKENVELKAQIEKMKCCGNCNHFNFNEPNYCHKGVYRERQYVCSEWEFGN